MSTTSIMLTILVVALTVWVLFVVSLKGPKVEWWVEDQGLLIGPFKTNRKAKRLTGRVFYKPKGWRP